MKELLKFQSIASNEDIVNGNVKLILGMVWQLILRYQLSGGAAQDNDKPRRAILPKKLILQWVNGMLPEGQTCKNFSRDWNDGIILSGLINYCDPSLLEDWDKLSPSNQLANCERAMTIAKEKLEIPMILSPEDLCSPEIDELSCITYISYFVQHEGPGWYATLNWVRSKVPERNVQNFQSDFNDGLVICGLAHAMGENCPGWQELDPEDKVANCQKGLNAGKELGIKPAMSAADLSQPNVNELDVMAYAASFHKAKGAKREIEKPVKIEWGRCATFSEDDINGAERSEQVFQNTKGLVTHQGLVNVPITVRVKLANDRAITTDISAEVDSPGEAVPITLKKISNNVVEASIMPQHEGIHTISVRCRSELIDKCPLRIMVMPDQSSFPENVKVGKITTAVVGEELQFQVDVSEAGKGELTVTISNGMHDLPVRLEQDGSMFTIFTIADAVGDYTVNILWDRNPVTDEPAKFRVFDPNRVTASGDGLTRGREDQPTTFVVDPSQAGKSELKVSVEGPNSMAKVTMLSNGDGTYTVTYVPTEVGIFNIRVLYGERLIYGAPFQAKITDPRKVRFAGFPTARNEYGTLDLLLKETYRVEVDTGDAGPGDLRAEMETANAILPVQVDRVSDSNYVLTFSAPKEGNCIIKVMWAGSHIKGSPFEGYAREKELPIDNTKVVIKGEGIRSTKVYVPTEFIIDGTQAGAGTPSVSITGTTEDLDFKLEPYGTTENMYKVTYMAEKAGTHIVYVAWSEKQIPNSPFKVNVQASPHAEKVRASSFKGLISGKTGKFIIDTRDAAEGNLEAKCMGPTKPADVHIGRSEDGFYSLLITPKEPGNHRLVILYGNEHINGSPFTLRVSAPPDASQVIARGPGLNHGIITDYNGRFICETKGAGAGQLKVRVHGPKGAFKVQMTRSSKKDRTIDVRYNPTEVGEYKIQVKWSDSDVPGSPFTIVIVENENELREVKRKYPIDPRFTSVSQDGWSEDL
ncbi:filamin-C-like isoform X3 [Apostichopus japonicus]|uniref:filamin-C-like isoform X3 n=1 Tax=Stichopus japonicus TaxID=307972 RepID=UPI003AB7AC0A